MKLSEEDREKAKRLGISERTMYEIKRRELDARPPEYPRRPPKPNGSRRPR